MKWIVRVLFICSVPLLSLACESEGEKYRRLNQEYDQVKLDTKEVEVDWDYLQKEQEKCWQSSAKERFGYLRPIQYGKWELLSQDQYVKAIYITAEDGGKHKIQLKIKPDTKIKPYFHIYLHDKQGLIAGYAEIKHTFWSVGAGKEKDYEKTIKTFASPCYFRIDIIN